MVAPLKIPPRSVPPLMVRLPNWVGDVVMCLPALKNLSALGMPMVICGRAWAKPLIQNVQYIKFVTLTGVFWHDVRALRQAVVQNMVGLSFPDSFSSALIFYLTGIPTLGYRDDGRSWLLKWPIEKLSEPLHAVEKWFYLADMGVKTWQQLSNLQNPTYTKASRQDLLTKQKINIGQVDSRSNDINSARSNTSNKIQFDELPQSIYISLQATQFVQAQLLLKQVHIVNQPYILIAPTATGQHRGQVKIWPHFAQLTRTLQQQGLTVVACPPQHEQAQALEHSPTVTLLQPTDLGTFGALAQVASLVICNDSGVSHIAAAVGANQITLFGVTDPKHTGPWSNGALCLGQTGQWPSLEEVLQAVKVRLTSPQTSS